MWLDRHMVEDPQKRFSLDFIRADIQTQIQLSRDLAAQIDELRQLLPQVPAEQQPALQSRIDGLLSIATRLASNAQYTATTSSTALSGVTIITGTSGKSS